MYWTLSAAKSGNNPTNKNKNNDSMTDLITQTFKSLSDDNDVIFILKKSNLIVFYLMHTEHINTSSALMPLWQIVILIQCHTRE